MGSETEEIKSRLDIVDVVSEYLNMKQSGTNWLALCPFHNEKSPSFMVSRDKQIFHCFGCNEGGDVFTFVQKMEGIDFPEALRLLAQKAGVTLVAKDPKLASQKNRLLDICKLTAEYWHKVLTDTPAGAKARSYLQQRAVKDSSVIDFKIGYAPESWDSLSTFLRSRGFKENEIFLAGLTVKKDRGAGFYDRFRDRLMFPINDAHGNPVGFTGRTLNPNEKGGKYVNTPQTLIYNKSQIIFNLDKAKGEIKRQKYAVMVEGQMDVISAYAAGTKNVIATSGTALTEEQITILKRYTDNLAIAFDTDNAGQLAVQRGIDMALASELNVKVIVTPGGKDPDEAIKTDPQLWFDAIRNAKSIIQYYFDQTFSTLDLNNVDDKKKAAKVLLPVIVKIKNQIEQTHWLQKLADRLNVSEDVLRNQLPQSKERKKNISTPVAPASGIPDRYDKLSEQVLGMVLNKPQLMEYLFDTLTPEMLSGESVVTLYKLLNIHYTENVKGNPQLFDFRAFAENTKAQNLDTLALRLAMSAEKDFFDFDDVQLEQELKQAVAYLKRNYYTSRLREIEVGIRQAEQRKDAETIVKLSAEFNQLISLLNLL